MGALKLKTIAATVVLITSPLVSAQPLDLSIPATLTEESSETVSESNEQLVEEASAEMSTQAKLGLAALAGLMIGLANDDELRNGDYRNTIEGDYLTEYNYQSMLSSINPLSLNDYGYDGTDINVAVVDSGIDSTHPEFDGKTIRGYDFASSATGFAADESGHGTHVASIIAGERDGSGMRGVAYDANLFSYKLDNDGDLGLEALTGDSAIAAIYNRHVTDNIKVSNNSWNSSSIITSVSPSFVTTTYANSIASLKAAQANGTLIVFSSGNNGSGFFGANHPDVVAGLPYVDSDLKDAWLVVTAVDSNLKETLYTNRCGVAYDFCVTAPGGGDSQSTDGILAAEANTGGYTRKSGTSMATPHVSGLAAALMEKFPTLTPAQIATRIKTTASLAGLTGYGGETLAVDGETVMQAIFGYGLVNSTAASASIGSLVFPTSGSTSGGTTAGASSLALPAAINGQIADSILRDTFTVFDTFDGATFTVTGDQLFKPQKNSFTPSYNLNTGTSTKQHTLNRVGFSHSFSEAGRTSIIPSIWGDKAGFFDTAPFVVQTPSHQIGWSTTLGGTTITSFMNAESIGEDSLSFSQVGTSMLLPVSPKLNLSVGYATGVRPADFGYSNSEVTKTRMTDFELGMTLALNRNETLFSRYSRTKFGNTTAGTSRFGTHNLSADAINLGYEVASPNSAMTLGIKSDSALIDGALSMALPTAVDQNGLVYSYEERLYGAKAHRTFDPYFAYRGDISHGTSWLFSSHLDGSENYSIGGLRLEISSRF